MNHVLRGIIAAQDGLATRSQALDNGLSPSAISQLLREGHLVAVRRGVYTDGERWKSLDEYVGKHRLRTRAALRKMTRGYVISHDSAAHELGLEILLPPEPHVHITRPGFTGAWTKSGVKHHLAGFRREQVVTVDGLRVLDMARTAVDIAREHGAPYGEIACDSAMRHGVPRSALEAAAEPMAYWPHIQRTRVAVSFADPGAQTVIESLGRVLVSELGLGHIDTQFPVRLEGGRVVWGDMRVGCHIFETDGEIKYRSAAEGGLATDPPHQVVWAERKRDRALSREGLGTSHIIWSDFWPPHRADALSRLRAEYDESVARFGAALPSRLARSARELRGQRDA